MHKHIFKEIKSLIHLALPLIFNLLAYMAMQFIDTVMLGRLGPTALAASALGNVIFVITLVGCLGVLTAVGTLTAQAYGEKDVNQVLMFSQQGLWVAFFLSIPAMFLLWNAHHFLTAIKQPIQVILSTREYLQGLFWGFLPDLGFIALREYTTAISRPKIVMMIAIGAIPLNAVFNYWFMYGGMGLPAMKVFGVGLATSLVSWLMLIALVIYVASHKTVYRYNILKLGHPKFSYIKRILSLGYPVGISFMVEEFLFVITAILMGYFGVTALAAHQIAVQCMLAIVMVPIGISQAAAVRVSQLSSNLDPRESMRAAYVAILSGLSFAIIAACFFWSVPLYIVSLFIDISNPQNQAVVGLATKLLAVIALFHIIDAVQIITNGALRGFQDTLIPMFLGLISFWLVGIGSGYLLGFTYNLGAVGLWWGLALGITMSALFLQLRLLTHFRNSRFQ